MTFLAPWAAWFAAGIPVIVLLYLLKLKRRPVPVSTLMFWQRALQESRRRALFQRLRSLLSLLLHLLIFLLILAALAKPTFDRFVATGSSTVVVLDTRARMQALEENGLSRFEKARQLASRFIREASGSHQLAILSAGSSPAVLSPFTGDENPLQEALATATASDAAGELEPTLRLAEDLLAARPGERRIVVLTDRAPPQSNIEPSKFKISYLPTGTTRDNVAITRFATRPLLTSPQTSEVLLEVRNFGRTAAKGNVEISFDGKLLDVRPFVIEPGARKLETFPTIPRLIRNARGWLIARLPVADALPLDNVAYAVLPTPQPHRVLLVTRGNWFLEKLLAADQEITFDLLDPDTFQLAMADKFDAVILDNALPSNFDLANSTGNFLFVKQSPFSLPGEPIAQPLITDLDSANPVLRLVSLQNVTVVRASPAQLPGAMPGWTFTAPLRAFEHPLMITGIETKGSRRVAALAFDLADSDLPLRIAFPLLISNTVHWLAGGSPPSSINLRTGETLSLAADQTVWTRPQIDPTKPAKPADTDLARTFFRPLQQGFYLLTQPRGVTWIAANSFSESESDLRGEDATPPTVAITAPMSLGHLAARPLWQYLALAALTLTTLEWWLFHRRKTE